MTPTSLNRDIEKIGQTVRRWNIQLRLMIVAGALLLGVFVLGMSDLLFQLGRAPRAILFTTFLAGLGTAGWWVWRSMRTPMTPQGIAARIERAFPSLDNHLINHLQFSEDGQQDAFTRAYLKQDIAGWTQVNAGGIKNRRLHRWVLGGLCAALIVFLIPGFVTGRAWAIAVVRVTNPFSQVQPQTLTRIISVTPGTTSSLQGRPLTLMCTVNGHSGHEIELDLKQADGEDTTHALGSLNGNGDDETFTHRIPVLSTALAYRFRAGDAPFPEWHDITPRAPLAFSTVEMTVTPPDYLQGTPRTVDALASSVDVPEGARLALRVTCNSPVTQVTLKQRNAEAQTLTHVTQDAAWQKTLSLAAYTPLLLSATDTYGDTITTAIPYTFIPDAAPVVQIIAPTDRPTLPPGTKPTIDLAVSDDYGLTHVALERVTPGSKRDTPGTRIAEWTPTDPHHFSMLWSDAVDTPDSGVMAFRIVATDNHPGGPHITRSSTILFNATSIGDVAREQQQQDAATRTSLSQLIALQRDVIRHMRSLKAATTPIPDERWVALGGKQEDIRLIMRELLKSASTSLGSLAPTARRLYLNEMVDAVEALGRIPATPASGKARLATQALTLQEKILRQLTYAEVAAAQTSVERHVSALSGMLTALIRKQTDVIGKTMQHVNTSAAVGSLLVDRQDGLASDLVEFLAECRQTASTVAGNDDAYAAMLTRMADHADKVRILDDMSLAAETLDENTPIAALPHQKKALAKLKALETYLDKVSAREDAREEGEMLEVLENAQEKFRKVHALHKQAIEAIDMVKAQNDSDERVDLMEEEYQELVQNTKEALLQVPKDLHIFTELNVANDLVEDVFSIFEEVEAANEDALSPDKDDAGPVNEKAYAKREELLEIMEEMEGRFDDIEMWLGDKAENDVITTEAFDLEEMPEAGVALGALAAQADDLIGDLLEDPEDGADRAVDSATNHAVPDDPGIGWEVKEGDLATFSAKGKSGNQVPDHKEQDGRSNVGRQGMSVGETAAGSGTISEGDSDIEARRTQDPTQAGQVDLDGEAEIQATGGGKQASGKAGEKGMAGGTRRMDSTEQGSQAGLEALMAQQVDEMYAKASLKNVRAGALKDAAHHLRQAGDAVAKGQPIAQIKEFRKRAVTALQRAKTELEAGPSASISNGRAARMLDDVVEGGPDEAPPRYRDHVADYYKKLNEAL